MITTCTLGPKSCPYFRRGCQGFITCCVMNYNPNCNHYIVITVVNNRILIIHIKGPIKWNISHYSSPSLNNLSTQRMILVTKTERDTTKEFKQNLFLCYVKCGHTKQRARESEREKFISHAFLMCIHVRQDSQGDFPCHDILLCNQSTKPRSSKEKRFLPYRK